MKESVKAGEHRENLFKKRFMRKLRQTINVADAKFTLEKTSKYGDIDFLLKENGVPILGVEFKERNIASYDYKDVMIRDRKVRWARKLLRTQGIHSIVVMRFLKDNKELFFDMRDWDDVRTVTRRDRGASEIHMFYNIDDAYTFDIIGWNHIANLMALGEKKDDKE